MLGIFTVPSIFWLRDPRGAHALDGSCKSAQCDDERQQDA
jgi:hypothetical protein